MNQLMLKVFVEQPLAKPGLLKIQNINCQTKKKNGTKLENSNCHNSKTQGVTKRNNSNCDKTKKKLNCDKTKKKNQIVKN